MRVTDRAIAAQVKVTWWTLVSGVAFRQGLLWGLVTGVLILVLVCVIQISRHEAYYTFAHIRAQNAVAMRAPNSSFNIQDEYGRDHVVTAFDIATHPRIRAVSEQTQRRFKTFSYFALGGGLIAFFLGLYSVVNGARR